LLDSLLQEIKMPPYDRKRRRDDSEERLSENSENAYHTLRELFPTKSWRYLRDKAKNWSGNNVTELIEELLIGDETQGHDSSRDKSLILLDGNETHKLNVYTVDSDSSNNDNMLLDDSVLASESFRGSSNPSTSVKNVHPGASSESGSATVSYMEKNLATLTALFPDVSPIYLQEKAWAIGNNSEKLEAFISESLEKKSNLPSRKEYEQEQEEETALLKVRKMVAADYLTQYEDPHSYFRDTTRVVNESYKAHTSHYLKKHFPSIPFSKIVKVTESHNGHFVPSVKEVEDMSKNNKGKKVIFDSHLK